MKAMVVRLPDEVMDDLKARAGRGQVNKVVTELVRKWLGQELPEGRPRGRVAPVVAGVLRSAADLPAAEIPAGAVCGADVRGRICGRPAKFSRGSRYFCEEH